MRVNLITKRGWILERCAQELADRIPDVTINAGQHERKVDPGADVHYYLPAKDIRKYPAPGLKVGFFTHGEETLDLARQFDACVVMNETMGHAIRTGGDGVRTGNRDVTLIRPGTDIEPKPITFGVIGRVYRNGRKGEALVRAAVDAGFTFVACGTDNSSARALTSGQWPCPTTHTTQDRDAFYHSIDYLVVPSLDEGGPMGVIEAIAHRVPVIAPDVGFCWEFPVIRYQRGSVASLIETLRGLTDVPTWYAWANEHRALFAELGSRASLGFVPIGHQG